ncbi:hypothetical protein [Nonomuraea sp. 3-1Str]|uniref:hypothetical protein n=1 Tax=unclassified Nonomuraea TaxID=2593643 RepID=UPI00285B8A43|nr:hypothetical protein [Nonomuraea sp. 3-1Str]MDR8407160.1 hypothetical protein [Nonomuraea sp. 3-1Str]
MASDLRRHGETGSAVRAAELIVSSARLRELSECSAVLRRTRLRAEEIMEETRALLTEAELRGDLDRIVALAAQLDEARQAYCKVVNAYVTICRRISEERQEIIRTRMEVVRHRLTD